MMAEINLYGVNGKRIDHTEDGRHWIPREVLERNALDRVEGAEDYGNLSFDDAQAFVELATALELGMVLTENFPFEKVEEVLAREELPSQEPLEVFIERR